MFGWHQPVGQARNVFAGFFGDGISHLFGCKQGGVGAVERVQHMVEGECVHLADPVIESQRAVPVIVVCPGVLS